MHSKIETTRRRPDIIDCSYVNFCLPSASRPSVCNLCARARARARVSQETCAMTHLSHGRAFTPFRRVQAPPAERGGIPRYSTVYTRPMRKRKYARISPIVDKAPGQQVTGMGFPSHMITVARARVVFFGNRVTLSHLLTCTEYLQVLMSKYVAPCR
jgi:hypothetical protein